MFLIADSGSTKTEWALIDNGIVIKSLLTKGFNPYYYQKGELARDMKTGLHTQLPFKQIRKVFFYGAGCSTTANCNLVERALQQLFANAQIEVEHDLFAAGLALLGDEKGVACILGTGSNSCLWENKKIIHNVPALGYMLGDEGSGTHIGKILLKGILLGEADKQLIMTFYKHFNLDFDKVMNRVYQAPDPNLFYSSLSPFVRKHLDKPFCTAVVAGSFAQFIERYLSKYDGFQLLPVSFTGSVAFHFQDILKAVLEENQLNFGRILRKPMDGLVAYHLGKEA
ncbi:MAG: ATPase [Bacteroidales bacterium]|nr:ATPase [Bacteroidales bacterium]